MPIALPEGLPAAATLRAEGIEVFTRRLEDSGSARGLNVALVNLMPDKLTTETQIARLLGASPFLVNLTLVIPDGYAPKSAPAGHIAKFYRRWSEIRTQAFDGLVVTGAPVEHLPYEEVDYWQDFKEILEWSRSHARRSLFICWAAQAALFHYYGVPKRDRAEKAFGVFRQKVVGFDTPLLRGFGSDFEVPVSRHTEISDHDLPNGSGVRVLARSPESGLCLLEDSSRAACYMFNHFEYDAGTLAREYARDLARGVAVSCPACYFPGDDPDRTPADRWRFHAQLFFQNWINEVALATKISRGAPTADDRRLGRIRAKPRLTSRLGDMVLTLLRLRGREAAPK